MKVVSRIRSTFRLFKAHKCAIRGLLIVGWDNLDAVDLTESCKVWLQVVNAELRWDVPHEEVAFLLGDFESQLLSLNH